MGKDWILAVNSEWGPDKEPLITFQLMATGNVENVVQRDILQIVLPNMLSLSISLLMAIK